MQRIRLIHWDTAGIEERAAAIRAAGYAVEIVPIIDTIELHSLLVDPPDAVVIDLTLHPMRGRELARMIASQDPTRSLPIFLVLSGPHAEAQDDSLPRLITTSWSELPGALAAAFSPVSDASPYSGRPLALKLGIQPGFLVGLIDAPAGFEKMLGELPPAARARRGAIPLANMNLWFVISQRELEGRIRSMLPLANRGRLWILWPKRSSGFRSDLTQRIVRKIGSAAGLVDARIGLLDDHWYGIRFKRRRGDPLKL